MGNDNRFPNESPRPKKRITEDDDTPVEPFRRREVSVADLTVEIRQIADDVKEMKTDRHIIPLDTGYRTSSPPAIRMLQKGVTKTVIYLVSFAWTILVTVLATLWLQKYFSGK